MAKTHVIDGVTYVGAHRIAEKGERVLIVNEFSPELKKPYKNGDVFTCYNNYDGGNYAGFIIAKERTSMRLYHAEYVVLEPLESEEVTVDSSQASPQVIEMFAALSRKIVSLERQLADTQRNVERQAEELENAKHRIGNHATMFGAVEEKVEMLTDDIVTLDERSQVLNAINKYYAEGSR